MQKHAIEKLLNDVKSGEISTDDALKKLENLPYEDLGFATIDHHRALRKGYPEVVFCENKTVEQAVEIMKVIADRGDLLATRVRPEMYDEIIKTHKNAEYNEIARTIVIRKDAETEKKNNEKIILILSAGTSDMPVSEEAYVTASVLGNNVQKAYDVGVAGLHRLLARKELIDAANVIIVVAGMDGALPSVVGGLVNKPVIAVPTSVGYGAAFQGVAPLLTMLNSCAPGVAVMNIDNGFGAGFFASMINK